MRRLCQFKNCPQAIHQAKASNLATEGLHILAMTLTDVVSPIGLLSIRCPTALFWRSLARTLSTQLHECYNWEDEGGTSSSLSGRGQMERQMRESASRRCPPGAPLSAVS